MADLMITMTLISILLWIIAKKLLSQAKSIRGKIVLITGSANGIGRALVKGFAILGCKVACVDVDAEHNETIVDEVNSTYPGAAKAYSCNVAIADEIKQLKEQVRKDFGVVNILVNNAAICYYSSSPVENNDAYMKAVIAVNLTGQILMVNAFLPDMLKCNEGHVVAMASASVFFLTSLFSVYTATKAGVKCYMESLALQLENIPANKVKTSIVYPYLVDTQPTITERFKNTLAAITPECAASAIIGGVMKESREIFVPNDGYRLITILFRLLPFKLRSLVMKKYEPDLACCYTDEEIRKYPIYKIAPETNKKIEGNV